VKRLLAAAVLAVSLHVLLFSLGAGRLIRRPPVWRPLPVTVMIAGLSKPAAGDKKTVVPVRKHPPSKARRVAAQVTEKTQKVSRQVRQVLEPQRPQKQVLKPKAAPVPLKAAAGRRLIKPPQPASAKSPPASSRAGGSAKKPVGRQSRSAGQNHNSHVPAAASAVQMATPLYWRNPPPRYPALARQRHYTGTVILEVLVDVRGLAGEVRVVRSSGYTLLDEAALAAVRRWQFAPGTEGGRPTAMRVKVPIRFRLR
jgi:protein TonB